MWIDDEGVCHTVALPDPRDLMSEMFRDSLDRLLAGAADDVADVIEAEEERFYEECVRTPASGPNEDQYVGVVPPEGLLVEPVATVDDLVLLIRDIDQRWRLDVLAALDDYLF